MAIAASSVTPTNSLEDFRIEFNNLVSDVTGLTATNKFDTAIIFEGATADAYETTLTVTDPTADRTVTLPNATGTVQVSGNVITGTTIEPTGDTSSGDNAAIGYTSAEGLILTGQGSTSDITLKNDADTTVFTVPTGTDDILFPDSAKAMFGASSDLQIYHDGSNSYIVDGGTGNLKIYASQLDILGTAETMATFVDDGAVTLYYDNSTKFATTSAGATVTGVLTATLQANAIDSDHYVDGSIDTAHFADDSVTEAKMANDAISSVELKTLSTLLIKNSGGSTLATFHTAGA